MFFCPLGNARLKPSFARRTSDMFAGHGQPTAFRCAAIAAKEFQEDLGAGPVAAAAPSGDNSMRLGRDPMNGEAPIFVFFFLRSSASGTCFGMHL